MRRACWLLGLAALLAGCGDRLRPGFCEKQDDCGVGERCDLEGGVAFHRCVAVGDGGAGDHPGRDGGGGPTQGPDADPGPDAAPVSCGPDLVCPPDRPLCAEGRCVECEKDEQCTDPARGACSGNACVDCRTAGAAACTGAGRICDPATGGCAECLESSQCKTPGKSFCASKLCVGCQEAGAGACKAPTAMCDATSGACVECTANSTCTDPKAPFCTGNRCVGCAMAAPQTCAGVSPQRPACGPEGGCIECNTSADCTADASKPICLERTCVACTTDAQCATKLGANPGVCLRHLGGRCATDAETIYVQDGGACGGTAGTAASPLCSPEAALPLVSATRDVVVVRGLVGGFSWNNLSAGQRASIIGQGGAVFAGGIRPGMRLSGPGEVYLRGVTVRSSEVIGVVAEQGATLRLDGVVVDTNRGGGILLDGAKFDLRDTLVTNNGAGETGAVIWGGILVQGAPMGGPARLERVSLVGNRQIGLTCDAAIEGTGVHARANAGGVEIGARCNVAACPTESASCGSSVTPLP
jgi:hypothetical protein